MKLKLALLFLSATLIALTVMVVVYNGWVALVVFVCGDIVTGLIVFWWGLSGRSDGSSYVIPPECRRRDLP